MRSVPNTPSFCRGPSRRAVLRLGLMGTLSLGFEEILRLRALGSPQNDEEAGKLKNCIMIWLAGGPSHLDTFDPKPEAPADVRGEFKPISTAVPGLQISEVFPNLARQMNRVTLVRSMTSPEADHDRAAHHWLTGYRPTPALVYPSHGSVAAKVREVEHGLLPPYVAIPDATLFASSGYLTPAYDPFSVAADPNQATFRVKNLTPPDRLTLNRLLRRRAMVKALDAFSRDVPETPLTASRDRFSERAYSLMTSAAAVDAFRIDREPKEIRDRYGRTTFGQSCLLARRLVEAGVSFVTVNDRGTDQLGWDTHTQNFPTIKNTMGPPLDQGLAALIADLAERGRLDDTLVVVMGEFGRTPKINANAGRDHHGRANSVILAGAGLPQGLVLGRTDSRGDSPADRPVTPADLASVIFHKLGIDPDRQLTTTDGRPVRLVDGGRAPKELI